MPQAIAYPVWKMIWTTTLKTGSWSNTPCMGPTSLFIKFLNLNRVWDPVREKWDPGGSGGTRWTRVGPGGTRRGPGGPGGTHEDLDGLRWKNMGAGCTSPGPSALLSAMSCDTVDLLATVINMEARKVDPNMKP